MGSCFPLNEIQEVFVFSFIDNLVDVLNGLDMSNEQGVHALIIYLCSLLYIRKGERERDR